MFDDQLLDDLYAAARAGDMAAFQAGVAPLWAAAEKAGPGEAALALERITGLFPLVPVGASARLAAVAVTLVERGAPPDAAIRAASNGLLATLTAAGDFVDSWRAMVGRKVPLPDPGDGQDAYETTIARLIRGRRWPVRRGLPSDQAIVRASAWFMLDDWTLPARTLLTDRRTRTAFPCRTETARLVARLAADRGDLDDLLELLTVLDDETLVVLHRADGRAYLVTICGVADNFQLYTLLAGALGDVITGLAPEPSWVAAAGTGPADAAERIEARFQLTDGYGEYVPVQGRPADIPLLEDRRVVVLDPPPYGRSWDLGRTHDGLTPDVRLLAVLDDKTAAHWRSAVAGPPAVPEPAPAHFHFALRRGTVEITA
ncbi:MAG TPA: hypothetical protein VGB74_10275 [Actinoplanes sp.]